MASRNSAPRGLHTSGMIRHCGWGGDGNRRPATSARRHHQPTRRHDQPTRAGTNTPPRGTSAADGRTPKTVSVPVRTEGLFRRASDTDRHEPCGRRQPPPISSAKCPAVHSWTNDPDPALWLRALTVETCMSLNPLIAAVALFLSRGPAVCGPVGIGWAGRAGAHRRCLIVVTPVCYG